MTRIIGMTRFRIQEQNFEPRWSACAFQVLRMCSTEQVAEVHGQSLPSCITILIIIEVVKSIGERLR
ncbi:hypothetical protein GUJ93_ZPchr0006g46062 [Zizania palustris]|uniref:Uncharacterized protein n=1 Tax=Zizania palustris TaxID=103762 RepID=A0A8J5SGJ1_ZIZPA|nr:hypothetical protein GUJ93_ZPchr0006g46062 [Zizania palustris]